MTAQKKSEIPQAPVAKKLVHRTEIHGETLSDDYFWLREKENPEVINHLHAENAYTEAVLAPLANLRETLFNEMKGRIKEDDSEVPYRYGAYFYYSRMEQGKQYPIICRKLATTGAEEILLDCNELAKDQKYFKLSSYEISPNHKMCAYAADYDGSEKFTIYVKDLATGKLHPETIRGASESLEWANDNRTLFYTMLDEHERPDRVMKHVLGHDPAKDEIIYKEKDSQLFVSCSKSRSERFLFIETSGKVTSEVYFLDADKPDGRFQIVTPRKRGVLYSVNHHEDRFLIVANDKVQNFSLYEAPLNAPAAWKEIKSGSPTLFIEDVEVFKDFLVIHERENGLQQLTIVDAKSRGEHRISFPEPTYSLGGQANAEYETGTYRFSYTSLVTPNTVYDYDVVKRTREVKKTQEIPSGYNRELYQSERVYATAKDGTKIPISLVYRKGEKGPKPLYLYGYGSYGIPIPAAFGTARLSLIDRGFVFAIAHIRGGSEMGRQWYDDGKFLKKPNTFTDFIACAEHLIEAGYTRKGDVACIGGSAGGMLVGNVINQRPDLFRAAAAHVPFVDVVNTMLDETLPLTTTEYEEWGNPNDPEYYRCIKSYSPYDNVRAQAYPHLLVTAGLNDPRVTYWEPAKWVAKLRELRTNENLLLQHIHVGAGHGGPSGRYAALKEVAMEYAFFLQVFGKAQR